MAAIEDQFQAAIEAILDFPAFGERRLVARQHQRRRQQRLAEFGQQRQRHAMIGNAQTDRLALGMQHAPRQFLRAFENEGVTARRGRLEQTILGVVDTRVLRDLGEVAAHQRQVVPIVHLADLANAIDRSLVAKVASKRIA